MNLSSNVKITKVSNATSAGQTAINATGVDTRDCEGVLFLVNAVAITSGGVQSINLAQSDDDGSTDDYTDIEGTKVTIADDDDNQAFWLEIKKPQKRYVRLEVARATQDSAFGPIWAFQHGMKQMPVSNNVTDTITGELHNGPAEGTA